MDLALKAVPTTPEKPATCRSIVIVLNVEVIATA